MCYLRCLSFSPSLDVIQNQGHYMKAVSPLRYVPCFTARRNQPFPRIEYLVAISSSSTFMYDMLNDRFFYLVLFYFKRMRVSNAHSFSMWVEPVCVFLCPSSTGNIPRRPKPGPVPLVPFLFDQSPWIQKCTQVAHKLSTEI